MKKLFSILVVIVLMTAAASAQYKVNKQKYDFRLYNHQVGDRYNPGIAGLCSFLVPGLGQMISGEPGRGAAFLGADLAFTVVYGVGLVKAMTTYDVDYYGNETAEGGGAILAGLAGMLVVDIWSIVDAVRVAKVNSMTYRDTRKRTTFEINPYLGNQQYTATGLSFKMKF